MVQMGVQIQMPHYMIIEQESISAVCVIESVHMLMLLNST